MPDIRCGRGVHLLDDAIPSSTGALAQLPRTAPRLEHLTGAPYRRCQARGAGPTVLTMAVDHEKRLSVMTAVLSFCRGELSREAFESGLSNCLFHPAPQGGKPLPVDQKLDHFCRSYLQGWDFQTGSAEDWSKLLRYIAYFQTKLDIGPIERFRETPQQQARERRLARIHGMCLLAAFCVAYVTHWSIALVTNILSSIVFWRTTKLEEPPEVRKQRAERRAWDPFANERQWQQYRHLVDQFELPDAAPEYFQAAHRESMLDRSLRIAFGGAYLAFSAIAFAYMYLWSVLCWPIWLLSASFSRVGLSSQPIKNGHSTQP